MTSRMIAEPTLSALEAARVYAQAGLSVVPVRTDGSKAPIGDWGVWQTRIPSLDELDKLFADDVGVGIVCGAVSENLEVIDFDSPHLFEPFCEEVERIQPGLIARLPHIETPRTGHHLYLRCRTISGSKKLAQYRDHNDLDEKGKPKLKTHIETKGEGGQVLAPGCPRECNPVGDPYHHVSGPPITKTPIVSVEERDALLTVARSFHEIVEKAPEPRPERPMHERQGLLPGDDFNRRGSFDDLLASAGWKYLYSHGHRKYWQRPGKSGRGASATTGNTTADGVELFSVFSSNAHPFEGGNDNKACTSYSKFGVYAMISHGGNYSAAAKALYAQEFGERIKSNMPPLDVSETYTTSTLNLEGQPATDTFLANGHAAQDGKRKPSEATQSKPKGVEYRIIGSPEFAAQTFEIEYLIKDVLVAGQPCIVGGPRKALKTSVVVDMAIALARGSAFLGKFQVERACKVLLMSGESGFATLQETAHRVCQQSGCELAHVTGLFWSEDIPQFASIEHEMALKQSLTENEIDVVFVDPTYLAMAGGDHGNLFAQGALLRGVTEACRSCGATLILVHHTKKAAANAQFAQPELDDLAWAGFQEYARQWILLGRREQYVPGTGEHRLWLSIGGSAGHGSLWALDVSEGVKRDGESRKWDITVSTPNDAKAEQERDAELRKLRTAEQQAESNEHKLWSAIKKFPQGETMTTLREVAGLSGKHASPALSALLTKGMVETCQVKKHTRTESGYRPVPGHARTMPGQCSEVRASG